MPPGLLRLGITAAGALALAVGLVALLNGRLAGIAIVAGAAALLVWSLFDHRVRR